MEEYRRGGTVGGYSQNRTYKSEIGSYDFPKTQKTEYNMREPDQQSERMIETKTHAPEIKQPKIETQDLEKSETQPETKKKQIETPAEQYSSDIVEMGW